MAGKLIYIAPVENASGKIFGLKNRFCAVKRSFGDRKKGCAFMGERDYVNHPVSQDELSIRSNFTVATKLVAARLKQDSPRFEADHNLYNQQNKVKATTFKKWLWAQVKANLVGIDYLSYGSKDFYPGGEALELNVAKNSQLHLMLVPGTGETLTGNVQVKINGTPVSNVTVEDDMLTATLPATLEGVEVSTVVLISDKGTYRLQY